MGPRLGKMTMSICQQSIKEELRAHENCITIITPPLDPVGHMLRLDLVRFSIQTATGRPGTKETESHSAKEYHCGHKEVWQTSDDSG